MTRLRARAVTAALVGLLLAAPSAAGSGGIGLRVDGTSGSQLTDGALVVAGSPGGTAAGHVMVSNAGTTAVTLHVDPVDGRTGKTSGVVFAGREDAQRDAGGWLALSTRSLTLAPGEERRIEITVRVPGAAARGDHMAGVAVEQRRDRSGITQVIRNVLPVLVDVGEPAAPQAVVRGLSVGLLAGTRRSAVTVRMANTGLRRCAPLLVARVRGSGAQSTPVTMQLGTILPGDEIPYPLLWPERLDGERYTLTATLTGCGAASTLTREVTPTGGSTAPTSGSGALPAAPPGGGAQSRPISTPARDLGAAPAGRAPSSVPDAVPPARGVRPSAIARRGDADASPLRQAADFVWEQAPAVLSRLAPPLLLLLLALLFLAVQAAIDRRDPRLARAPREAEPDLLFLPVAPGGTPPQSIR